MNDHDLWQLRMEREATMSEIWARGVERLDNGEMAVHGVPVSELLKQFGSPLYVIDTDDVRARAHEFVSAVREAFANTTTHVSYAAKAFMSKEILRIVTEEGMYVDTCTLGEMRIALAAGVPGRRIVLHGNNKSDEEIELAIEHDFAKIVIDEPYEAERIEAIARRLGKRARVMVRVTSGIHAGGHEYISTAHEDQKFGIPLVPAGANTQEIDAIDAIGTASMQDAESHSPHGLLDEAHERVLTQAMQTIAQGGALQALEDVLQRGEWLELVGIHSHIGSNIHDADAFIHAAHRMQLLRKTLYATTGYTAPEIDLGGGYSVAYTEAEDSMDIHAELNRLATAMRNMSQLLGIPMPTISFEPGRWVIAPTGMTLYRVGTVKTVPLSDADVPERVYVSVDGGMSDNIRTALYDADYTAVLANRMADAATDELKLSRVVGMHCESGDIVVKNVMLPASTQRGDILAVPVTGAYGRTMASNYNQALIPAVVGVNADRAHVMLRRQTVDDLLNLDVSE